MSDSSRREFLQTSALAGVGFWVAGGVSAAAKAPSPNEKLNIACIGVGGKGDSDTKQAGNHGNIVALCDIDDNTLNGQAKNFPDAKKYNDYRKMFDEMGKSIDAVTVSTPDHSHTLPSMIAMQLGKHVYCQKPLTHTVFEARQMREAAKKYKVATQMGNQGTAEDGLRTAVEIIRSGAIGPVKEVHVWTNRPIWPQGTDAILRVPEARNAALAALRGRALEKVESPKAPKHVHWDTFLGPAPERPFAGVYHPFSWRGWLDFGTGALGDMACHTANMAFMALKLGYPTTVMAESGDTNPETFPMWAKIVFQFPARDDMPPVKFTWYEGARGNHRVLPPDDLLAKVLKPGERISDSGSLLVGDKGILYSPNDYGASFKLLPEQDFGGFKAPEPTLARNGGGDDGMKKEWVAAIRGGAPAMSNFDYAGMLTETILLGNVAVRVGNKKVLEWDGPNLKFTNAPEADQYIKTEYRKGWTW
jgi:predicted dehydrogenase